MKEKKFFTCKECDETYKTERGLQRHVLVVHEKRKPHQCKFCSLKFPMKSELKLHIAKHHKMFN